jgi:hypothetical protein
LRSGRTASELATPSPTSCKWCPFKLLCSIFWKVSSPTWSGTLDGAAVEGVLRNAPRAIHAGAAFTIELQIESGTETLGKQQIGPFNASVHPILASLSAGDRIRIVGLRSRSDSKLLPTQRTVLARVADVPEIVNAIQKNN